MSNNECQTVIKQGKYKIKSVVYNRESIIGIPYIVCMVIKGPKGGWYVADRFTLRVMLNKAVEEYGICVSAEELVSRENLRYINYGNGRISEKNNDESVKYVAGIYKELLGRNVEVFIRDSSKRVLDIGKQLEIIKY